MKLGLLVDSENVHKVYPISSGFLTLDHMGTPLPLKFKNSKIGLRHVLNWPKLGLETKFHYPETFDDFGKRAQSLSDIQRIFNTGPYGYPP